MRKKNNFSIFICTCQKYSDLWDTHIELMNKNWKERNVDTFLLTDEPTEKKYPEIQIVAAGKDAEITERLKAALKLVNTKYV